MGKLIDFKSKPFSKVKSSHDLCEHNNIIIDEKERKIECNDCNRILDPIDYLIGISLSENSMWSRYCNYDKEISKLRKTYDNLTKEIERIKKIRNKIKKPS